MVSFLLRHAFFLAICAGCLSAETCLVLQLDCDLLFFIPASLCTLLTYNIYLFIGETFAAGGWFSHRNAAGRLGVMLMAACGLFFYLMGHHSLLPVLCISVLLALPYFLRLLLRNTDSVPAFFQWLKPCWLALIWAYVTVYFVTGPESKVIQGDVIPVFIGRLLFLLPICLVFEKKESMNAGHGNPPHPNKLLQWGTYFLITWIVYMLFSVWQYQHMPERMAAYLLAGFAILPVYLHAGKGKGFYYYALLTDGLMMLPFLLMQFQRFWLTCLYN
jgi:hypothetical protein